MCSKKALLLCAAAALLCTAGMSPKPKKQETQVMKKAPIDTIFNQGEPNPYGKFFTGQTYLNMLSPKDDVFNAPIGNVTFEPGARTHWHKHDGGQILLVLNGEGRYQEKGKEIQILHKGDIVRIAPGVTHWHGAAPESWFVHISLETNAHQNGQTEWLDAVTDEQYK
nr:cupin domain-containing protein [Elusimicrobium sp. An273]